MIEYTLREGWGELLFNDPARLNAMGEAMAAEFRSLYARLRVETPRCLILTGAGRAFSAGGDLDMLEAKRRVSVEENRRLMLEFYASFLDLLRLEIPLIAAIHGHAVGAGMVLACACDIRLAEPDARLGFPFARLGLHPGMGATWFVPRAAAEMLLTGRMVDAEEGLRLGLLTRIASPVLEEARAVAAGVVAGGPEAVRATLRSLRHPPASLQEALEREAHEQALSYARPEFAEGLRAALEKRRQS